MTAPLYGVLGETTVVTHSTTTTIYTAPANRAAKIRVQWVAINSANTHGWGLLIGTPGAEHQVKHQLLSNVDSWSGMLENVDTQAGAMGSHDADYGGGIVTTEEDSGSFMPWPYDFFLSPGDTVRVIVGNTADLTDHLIQVIGAEYDSA